MKDFGLKKLYYSISEVSKLTELEQYILRYWETEFDQLNPSKNRAGNRIYTNKDIKTILEIKELLRNKRYTIEGAKKILTDQLNKKKFEAVKPVVSTSQTVKKIEIKPHAPKNENNIKKDLEELKEFLLDLHSKL